MHKVWPNYYCMKMNYKTLKSVAIIAVIFGIAGIGYGWKTNSEMQHPSRSSADGVPPGVGAPGSPAAVFWQDCKDAGGTWSRRRGTEPARGDTQYYDECLDKDGKVIGGVYASLPPVK